MKKHQKKQNILTGMYNESEVKLDGNQDTVRVKKLQLKLTVRSPGLEQTTLLTTTGHSNS